MATATLEVVPSGQGHGGHDPVRLKVGLDVRKLLPKGISPQEVAETYFRACWDKDSDLWLATLHLDRRADATSSNAGPFQTCDWDLGRARVEKYMIQYRFRSQSNVIYDGADPMLTLIYEPLYGPVPGYKQGTPLGPEVRLILRKEGGEEGEWRVFRGIF